MANPIVTGYSVNDFYYTNTEACPSKDTDECNTNLTLSKQLLSTQSELSGAQTHYEDVKKLYNRELIFTVNLLIGVAMLIYYVYINKDVLPAVPEMPAMPAMPSIMPKPQS
jgi:hypothetical protein